MKREPVVAGQFYPGEEAALQEQIKNFIDEGAKKEEALGTVLPHAGYIYSGKVAGAVYSRLILPEKFVIIGPNHTGQGRPFSIVVKGRWKTPLGEVEIDSDLAKEILAFSQNLEGDEKAHSQEHSIEVQIPFLQYLTGDFRFVPIILSGGDLATCREIGGAIVRAIKAKDEKVTIIASSDMTHYESQESAERKDRQAIEAILQLNEEELLKRVRDLNISMCGYAPVATMLSAVKQLGAKRAELVRYMTSGDASGDYSAVVGYAGVVVK